MTDSAIEGLEGTLAKFNTLRQNAKKKYTQRAARRGMQVVKAAAKQNAAQIDDPDTDENISKNIDMRAGRSKDNTVVIMKVGVLGGASRNRASRKISLKLKKKKGQPRPEKQAGVTYLAGGDTRYWRHKELGTKHVQATPFLRPALFDNQQQIVSEFSDEFKTLVAGDMS